ncbi:116 kDa U5 small nuclear ribonucleoprotein component [Angomonas deanei]|uniref:Elongation factor Tu GTP binding domain/Elongation factor G, domain IV/Elongation factor G C-terminus, putative n=1 Tax=Angomonas deanei TaxID=59799 RepID=A0A7G2CA74_9TRYP|nr:116 kDa U5 small nuclear ribonucleoprotein component [Angomonas deanei]CAD2216459.1 Elongation factor Tu GTP binding domain/Elongation factor G, domain IV/Elongation factor G C-terminus, putative [Angomonas deanei]|eukprot:EPY26845.1 116 kDa U5 small nuclear ribonucleoprotein component [Angomonas deanei]
MNSDSDSNDSVEVIVGETGVDSSFDPLLPVPTSHHTAADRLLYSHDSQGRLALEQRKTTSAPFEETLFGSLSRFCSVVVIGALHHGKTSLLKLFTPTEIPPLEVTPGRGISVRNHVFSSLLSGGCSYPSSKMVNFIDTPGHSQLFCEAAAGMRLADVALLCVDAVEGLDRSAENLVKHAVQVEEIPIVLVITKVDRLLGEQKLPPTDAYRKLLYIVDSVNNTIASYTSHTNRSVLVSPENGTVWFSSFRYGFLFSLESFACKYAAAYPALDAACFSQKLWGPLCFEDRTFKKITKGEQKPTFVSFVLEPLYKVVAHAITGGRSAPFSSELDPSPRSPLDALTGAMRTYLGNDANDVLHAVLPTVHERQRVLKSKYCPKQYPDDQRVVAVSSFSQIADPSSSKVLRIFRVLSGTVRAGADMVMLDDSAKDANSSSHSFRVKGVYRPYGGTLHSVDAAGEGQVVFIEGVPPTMTSHILMLADDIGGGDRTMEDFCLFPIDSTERVIHVSLELKEPTALQRWETGLGGLLQTSCGLSMTKEETGEYTFSGYGELHLDVALQQLRQSLCPSIATGVSKPFVSFSESVFQAEGVLALSSHKEHESLGFVCGKADPILTRDLTEGRFSFPVLPFQPSPGPTFFKEISKEGQSPFWAAPPMYSSHFDLLDIRHVIAPAPDKTKGSNIFVDDTLPEECVYPKRSRGHWETMLYGFNAAMKNGPLVGEVVRDVVTRLVCYDIRNEKLKNAAIRSHTRNGIKDALLGAKPRLLEPVFSIDVLTSDEYVDTVTGLFQKRRGVVVSSKPIPASIFTRMHCRVPAIETFGLETQIRVHTSGQAYPSQYFSDWEMVSGDPFDNKIQVGPREPAKAYQLSRDFVSKTRFRKGLPPLEQSL